MSYLAVDIGGTKTLLVLFDNDGQIKKSVKFETPALYETFLEKLAHSVAKLSTNNFKGCVVAIPGKVNRETGVGIAFGNLAWQNVPIKNDVQKIVSCPVTLENDANLAGLSEARLLPEYKRVLYITISTGIGGAVIVNGRIEAGTKDAEIGHILLEHQGTLQRWEDFASGKAIIEKFGKRASEIDPRDYDAWYLIARNIAIGLIDVIAMLTPDAIVVGGGVGAHFLKFKDRLLEELDIYSSPLLTIPPIFQANHPEEAVVYGCYELAKEKYGKAA